MRNKLFLCSILLVLTLSTGCKNSRKEEYLKRTDWCDNVRNNINDFIYKNNKNSNNYSPDNYVVFDFDNTCSIFDIEEQCLAYQLTHMAFAFPDATSLADMLKTDINLVADISPYPGNYINWINDICTDYDILLNRYGTFTPKGIQDETILANLRKDSDWQDFATKVIKMYEVIDVIESHDVSYPWVTYLFSGMEDKELYDLAKASHSYYKNVPSSKGTMKATKAIDDQLVEFNFTRGISVSENIVELMKQLSEQGIKVWVCSASYLEVVEAAIDVFGLHDYVTGVIAMTNKHDSNGKLISKFDYNGKGALAKKDNKWEADQYVACGQPQGKGKVAVINNALYARYGKGPIAGFMDSTGDFNFCTEYNSLQLVVCFNRANRSISDGGGLIAVIAMYQQEILKEKFESTYKNKETLYLLQGREENNLRSLRNSNKSILLGESEEKLFKNDDNFKLLNYFKENKKPIKDYINKFAIKTSSDDPNNPLNVNYGFLTNYSGYHSIR